jgi:hypothetical protein
LALRPHPHNLALCLCDRDLASCGQAAGGWCASLKPRARADSRRSRRDGAEWTAALATPVAHCVVLSCPVLSRAPYQQQSRAPQRLHLLQLSSSAIYLSLHCPSAICHPQPQPPPLTAHCSLLSHHSLSARDKLLCCPRGAAAVLLLHDAHSLAGHAPESHRQLKPAQPRQFFFCCVGSTSPQFLEAHRASCRLRRHLHT